MFLYFLESVYFCKIHRNDKWRTNLYLIQFHIYCVCNLKITTGFQNEKRTNKKTNKKVWFFYSSSKIYGQSSQCSLTILYSEAATEVFFKKALLKNYAILTGEHLCFPVFSFDPLVIWFFLEDRKGTLGRKRLDTL